MNLFIDTTRMDKAIFGVEKGGEIHRVAYQLKPYEGHKILIRLKTFITKYKINTAELRKIVVSKGPGSFVGTRVGLSVALALGFALRVKVKTIGSVEMEKFLGPDSV